MVFKKKSIALVSVLFAGGCWGGKSDHHAPGVPADPVPNATLPTPQAVVHAPAEPGFTNSDLLKAYCTATPNLPLTDSVGHDSAPSDQPYLITDVEHDNTVMASLLFLRPNGDYGASNQLNSQLFTSTSCDLAKLKEPVTVLLAGFDVFAKADLSGNPVCSYKAGVLPGALEDSRAIGNSAWEVKVQGMTADCQGLDHGYTDKDPNFLLLYLPQ